MLLLSLAALLSSCAAEGNDKKQQHKLFQFHIRVTKNSLLLPDLFALPSYLSE